MRKLYPASEGPLSNIPPTGCSPTLMRVDEWMRVTPRWEAITAQVGRHRVPANRHAGSSCKLDSHTPLQSGGLAGPCTLPKYAEPAACLPAHFAPPTD